MTQGPRVIFCSSLCAPLPLRATESAQNRPKRCDFERLRVSCPSPFALRATGSAENRPKRCDFGWLGFFPVCLCPFATPRRRRGGRVGGRLAPQPFRPSSAQPLSPSAPRLPRPRCLPGAAGWVCPAAAPGGREGTAGRWTGWPRWPRCPGGSAGRGTGRSRWPGGPGAPGARWAGGQGGPGGSGSGWPRCPGGSVGRWTGCVAVSAFPLPGRRRKG